MTEMILPKTRNFKIPWKQDVWEKMHVRNEDCIIAYIGKRGKGKSTSCVAFCHSMDEGFNEDTLRERCFIHPIKFMEWAKKPKKDLYQGLAIMFDEVGVGVSSREWHNFNNRAFHKVMQIMRHKNFLIGMTLPNLGFLDAGPRAMIDYVVEALVIDREKSINVCKVKEMRVNPITGEFTTPFLRYKINDTWFKYSQPYLFKRPPRGLMRAYNDLQEEMKQEFEGEMYDQASQLHSDLANKEMKKFLDLEEVVKKILENKNRYMRMRAGKFYIDKALIEYEYKVGRAFADRVKKGVEAELNKDLL